MLSQDEAPWTTCGRSAEGSGCEDCGVPVLHQRSRGGFLKRRGQSSRHLLVLPSIVLAFLLLHTPAATGQTPCLQDQVNECDFDTTCIRYSPTNFTCICMAGLTGIGLITDPCVRTTCNVPNISNAAIQPVLEDGKLYQNMARVEFLCHPGFTPNVIINLCNEGDKWDPPLGQCLDIDECANGTHRCVAPALCRNTQGSHECLCEVGYQANGTHCIRNEFTCPPLIISGNQAPSGTWIPDPPTANLSGPAPFGTRATLVCSRGFQKTEDIQVTCTDIDNSWRLALTAVSICEDVDECSMQGQCGTGATCANSAGSYECTCPGQGVIDPGRPCLAITGSSTPGQSTPRSGDSGDNNGGGALSTPILIILVVVATVIVVFFVVVIVVVIVSRRQDKQLASSETNSGFTNADYGSPQHIIAGKRLSDNADYCNTDVTTGLPAPPPLPINGRNGSIGSSPISPVLATPDSINSSVFFFPPGIQAHQLSPQQQQQLFIQQQLFQQQQLHQQQQKFMANQLRRGQDVAPYHTSEVVTTLGRHGTNTSDATQTVSVSTSSESEGQSEPPVRSQSPTGHTMRSRLSSHYLLPHEPLPEEEPTSPRSPNYDTVAV